MKRSLVVLGLALSAAFPRSAGAQTERAVPAGLRADLELPGSGRWLHLSVEPDALVGCETRTRATGCRATRRVPLDSTAQAELRAAWGAFVGRPGCRVRISMAGWTSIAIHWPDGSFEDLFPADASALAPVDCFTVQRLAAWLVGRWRSGRNP